MPTPTPVSFVKPSQLPPPCRGERAPRRIQLCCRHPRPPLRRRQRKARSPGGAKGVPPSRPQDARCPGWGAPPPQHDIHGWKAQIACTTLASVVFVSFGFFLATSQIPAPPLVCVELNPGPPRQQRQQRAKPATSLSADALRQLQQTLAQQQRLLESLTLNAGLAPSASSPRTGRSKPAASTTPAPPTKPTPQPQQQAAKPAASPTTQPPAPQATATPTPPAVPPPKPSLKRGSRSQRSTTSSRTSRTSAWTSSTLTGPRGRVVPGVPNTDHESCAAISLSSALRETLPGQTTETAAEFVANARAAFPEVKNPFLLLEALAPPELTIHARRVSGCGCPSSVAEAPQTGVTYYRPSTTETQRPVHIQAICSSLSYPHPYRCDACHALTTTSQCFDGTPEYVVIDTPRQRYVPEGDLAVDDAFPGVFHETRRPVYFNGAPYRTMAVICQVPGHFVTVIPRGHTFLCVDDGHPVRPLSRSDVTTLFKGTLLTFLARLHSKPAQQVRFQPTSSASTETAQPVNPTSIGSVAVATSISPPAAPTTASPTTSAGVTTSLDVGAAPSTTTATPPSTASSGANADVEMDPPDAVPSAPTATPTPTATNGVTLEGDLPRAGNLTTTAIPTSTAIPSPPPTTGAADTVMLEEPSSPSKRKRVASTYGIDTGSPHRPRIDPPPPPALHPPPSSSAASSSSTPTPTPSNTTPPTLRQTTLPIRRTLPRPEGHGPPTTTLTVATWNVCGFAPTKATDIA